MCHFSRSVSQMKVGMMNASGQVRSCQLVKPVPMTLVTSRYLNHQKGLPHVPVPPLRETCESYISFLEPIVEEDELKQTKQLVEEFMKEGGVGEKLQRMLEKKACNTDNWVSSVTAHYFENRNSVVIYSNYSIVYPRMAFRDEQEHISVCVTRYFETLPAENFGGNPLCMEQYSQLLSACRIPGLETDSVMFHGKNSNYITVAHNSQFFMVDVYNSDGTLLTVDQLCVQLKRICNSSEIHTEPVGILTTLNRDSWSKVYLSLIKEQTNKESLSAIERSICTVCLDRAMPQESQEFSLCDFHLVTHGGGSQWNSANRWFDKSLQIIIAEDGSWGINVNHIAADATVTMAFTDYLVASMKKPEMMQSAITPSPMPQKLHFSITPDIRKVIEEAKRSMDRNIQNLDLNVMVFDHFGKDYLKARNLSPDAFIQMALLLAYYRMNKQCCASYEAAFQRMFRHGRISLVLPTSSVSAAFVKAFDDPKKQNTQKINLLEKAIKTHRENTNAVIRGHDIVIHLYALNMQAVENKISMPDIFTDTSYNKFLDFQLITSQVTSKTGSVVVQQVDDHTGYHGCYGVYDSHFVFELAASNTYKRQNAHHLIQAVKDALLDMRALLEQSPRAT
uniref:Carnitine O-acetyltransferase a n=1 Tax=Amphilophus citrinellus TaxID=61819 RepID=A0A3Q0RFV5_AMPCI